MRKSKAILSIALSLAVAVTMLPGTALAAGDGSKSVKVKFAAGTPTKVDMKTTELSVSSGLAEKYFPEIKGNEPEGVSFADALVAAHIEKYGENKVAEYMHLKNGTYGSEMVKQFGEEIVGAYYADDASLSMGVSDEVKNGQKLFAMAYDDYNYGALYGFTDQAEYTAVAGKALKMKLTADNWGQKVVPTEAKLNIVGDDNSLTKTDGTYSNGTITATFDKAGEYTVYATGKVKYESSWAGTVEDGFAGAMAKVIVLPKAPAAPKIFTYVSTSKKTVDIKWKKVSGATGYEVLYKKVGDKKYKINKIKGTSVKLKNQKPGGLYEYKVLSKTKSGDNEVKGKASKVRYRYIQNIKKLKLKPGKSKVKISWKKTAGATKYQVTYYTNKSMTKGKTFFVKKTGYTIKGQKKGKKVYVRVRPVKTKGSHDYIGAYCKAKTAAAK